MKKPYKNDTQKFLESLERGDLFYYGWQTKHLYLYVSHEDTQWARGCKIRTKIVVVPFYSLSGNRSHEEIILWMNSSSRERLRKFSAGGDINV